MFGLGLDEQLGSGQSMRSEATDELIGKPYGNKGQGVSPVGRWVERPVNGEICWRVPESERSLVETPGKPVSKAAFGTKPSQHRTLVQLGELAQRANPEPPEDVGEHWQAENLHAEVTEPLSDSHHEAQPRLRGRRAGPQTVHRQSLPGTVAQEGRCRPPPRRPRRPRLPRPGPARRGKPPHRSNGRGPGQVGRKPRAW